MIYDNGITTFRDKTRRAPHNLYSSTEEIREWADDREWPDVAPLPIFTYALDAPKPTEEATFIELQFSDHAPSTWTWDEEDELYLHSYGDEPHMSIDPDDDDEQQLERACKAFYQFGHGTRNPLLEGGL